MGGWGDMGPARPTTKEYSDGWDKIFGKKDEKRDNENREDNSKGEKSEGSKPAK